MSRTEPTRVSLGGTVMQLALAPGGVILALSHPKERRPRLAWLDLAGRSLEQRELAWPPAGTGGTRHRLRVAEDGAAWVGGGTTLEQVGPGRRKASVGPDGQPGECLGSYLLLPDGFIVCFFRPPPAKDLDARVARLDPKGKALWSTTLPAEGISYAGVVEMGVDTGWQPRPMRPWQPRDWQPTYHEPLLLSGSRLLCSYYERSSGIGYSCCLDAADGRLLWRTEPRPSGTLAIAGRGEFLVGSQGYGAFDTYLYGPDGELRRHWTSHGDFVVTPRGEVRGVEMENQLPSRMHFSVLEADGTVRKGPHLDGYYTSYPALSREGVTAFWRDGRLWAVDDELGERTLWADRSLADRRILTRMLLAEDGTLIFALEDELFLMSAALGPLAESPWPCGGGNARGNPVWGID